MKPLTDIIDDLCSWLDTNVCSRIQLLDPDDENQDSTYQTKRIKPKVYPLFTPWADSSPETILPGAPGIVVGMLEGIDDVIRQTRTLTIQLQLITFHPGLYGNDVLYVESDKTAPLGRRYYRKHDENQSYQRSQEGWKDSYNFLSLCLAELEKAEMISGMRIKLKDGQMNFGHYRDDTGPVDLWPYWINYIRFELEAGNRTITSYEDKL